jgi:hypothetical protein
LVKTGTVTHSFIYKYLQVEIGGDFGLRPAGQNVYMDSKLNEIWKTIHEHNILTKK